MPSSVARSARTASTSAEPVAAAASSSAACDSASSPRAEMHTWQPSATSARALASPSPRLEPVTIATLPWSPRSMAPGQAVGRPERKSSMLASKAMPCSRFDRWPAPGDAHERRVGQRRHHGLGFGRRRELVLVADDDQRGHVQGGQQRRRVGPLHHAHDGVANGARRLALDEQPHGFFGVGIVLARGRRRAASASCRGPRPAGRRARAR